MNALPPTPEADARPINLALCQALRKTLQLAEVGEIIGGVFAGMRADGLPVRMVSTVPGPMTDIINTALDVVKTELVEGARKAYSQTAPSSIVLPTLHRG